MNSITHEQAASHNSWSHWFSLFEGFDPRHFSYRVLLLLSGLPVRSTQSAHLLSQIEISWVSLVSCITATGARRCVYVCNSRKAIWEGGRGKEEGEREEAPKADALGQELGKTFKASEPRWEVVSAQNWKLGVIEGFSEKFRFPFDVTCRRTLEQKVGLVNPRSLTGIFAVKEMEFIWLGTPNRNSRILIDCFQQISTSRGTIFVLVQLWWDGQFSGGGGVWRRGVTGTSSLGHRSRSKSRQLPQHLEHATQQDEAAEEVCLETRQNKTTAWLVRESVSFQRSTDDIFSDLDQKRKFLFCFLRKGWYFFYSP